MTFNRPEFLIETLVPEDELIISRTDLNGIITYANETFARISGYDIDELVGQPHNILRHPDMPSRIFKELWECIKSGHKWEGIVKNMRKDSGFYWVHAQISGVYKAGELVEYKSIRTPIDYATKLQYQRRYDAIRAEDHENIRTITYTGGS